MRRSPAGTCRESPLASGRTGRSTTSSAASRTSTRRCASTRTRCSRPAPRRRPTWPSPSFGPAGAVGVVRVVEAGRLDLDQPVISYVPELRMADDTAAKKLTLRHLLTHTGGHEGDPFDDFGGGTDCLSRLAAGMHVLPQLAPIGTWSYSNAGFSLAGRALETATGLVFEDAIGE